MKYMGSKNRIAKELIPIIQEYIEYSPNKIYIEPFVGGANVIDKIQCEHRWAYDANEYLIELLKYVQGGGVLPDSIGREEYCTVRSNRTAYPKWYAGAVGFLASYNGRFFQAYSCDSDTKNGGFRNYWEESKNNIMNQVKDIQGIQFIHSDYRDIPMDNIKNCVIYCDPPYEGTKEYSGLKPFNSVEFWNIMREWSKHNIVLISEQVAPLDFPSIWQCDVTRTVAFAARSKVTENLYIHESHVNKEDNMDLL